jgi:hypothetical protein
VAGNTNSIYMQRWLGFHPYDTPQQSDFYYLKLCNEIFELLRDEDFPDEEIAISDEQKKDLACFLVCYFEDVISGPGLWKAFTIQVDELYGTYLPFFDPDPEEYYPDEINPEDVYFLLWYYLSMIYRDESIISPTVYEWSDETERIFEILEKEYELAPANLRLQQFFQISPGEDNFYEIRDKLKWIMLDSWLHYFMREEMTEMITNVISRDGEDPLPEESRAPYIYDTIDTFILTRHTPLLARQGKEWLAYVVGRDHPLHRALLDMGEKKSGFYLYTGTEGEVLLFKHIATSTELRVSSRSMEVPKETVPGRSISYGGFVKWKDEWWFSGARMGWGYDKELIRKEEESEESRMLFGKDPAGLKEENRKLYISFLKFNLGKPLAFVENVDAAEHLIHDFIAYHNRSVKGSERKGSKVRDKPETLVRKNREEMGADLLSGKDIPGMTFDQEAVKTIPGMVYCDPDLGIAMAFGYNDYVPDPGNPWYMDNNTEEIRIEGTMRMLESHHISGNWMKYLASNYDLPGLEFPGLGGSELLLDDFDFMLRFWKREAYHG